MATNDYSGDIIPAPGFTSPTRSFVDDELLYSTNRFTQKGVTLKGGQGILPLGTVLARETTTKKWVAYNNSGGDGADQARGVLRRTTNTGGEGSGDVLGNIVISGILKNNKVSGADANAITDLGARVDLVLNTFTI